MRTVLLAAIIFLCGAAPPKPWIRAVRPVCVSTFTVYPKYCNHMGTLFGGEQLARMDTCAGIVVRRLLKDRPDLIAVTSAVERVEFRKPGKVGDTLTMTGRIVRLAGKAVTVRLSLDREDGEPVSWGDFTFVTLDAKTKKSVEHGLE